MRLLYKLEGTFGTCSKLISWKNDSALKLKKCSNDRDNLFIKYTNEKFKIQNENIRQPITTGSSYTYRINPNEQNLK